MDIKQKLLTTIMIIMIVMVMPSCGGNDGEEPYVYDPAGEIAGTYIGTIDITNDKKLYHFDNVSFTIRKNTTGSVYFDIVREDGKILLSNIMTTVGYSEDKTEYILASINENGTITQSGYLYYKGKCSVNGEEGYKYTFKGNKKK